MRLLGAEVVPVETGTATLKDAINDAMRAWALEGTPTLMVFDRDGAVQAAFGGPGADPSNLSQPNGIVFDPAGGLLLVADGGSGRILAFPEVDW